MADQIVRNEVPATNNQWFQALRLVEQLILAGWSVVESSDGTTADATDRWTGNFGSLGADAWIILGANSGQEICFRRGTSSSTGDGWITWSKGGGFTTGGTASAPANIPADRADIRGTTTAGTPGTFTTDGPWLGATSANTFDRLSIWTEDATGTGDEAFWVIAKQTAVSYTSTTAAAHGRLALEFLAHPAGVGITDSTPYAWWCPTPLTGTWGEGLDDLRCVSTEDSSAGTAGRWRRWWPGLHAQGSITTIAVASLVDGETFVLDDGVNAAVTFEFDGDSSVVESATLRQVDISAITTADQVRDAIITAVINAPTLDTTAVNSGSALVSLSNDSAGVIGNVAITETVTNAGFVVTGMSGGVSESFNQYGSGNVFQGDSSSERAGDFPGWENAGDNFIYQSVPVEIIRRLHLTSRAQVAFKDSEGGWTQNVFFHNEADSVNLDTFGATGQYAKFGNWLVLNNWNSLSPPTE